MNNKKSIFCAMLCLAVIGIAFTTAFAQSGPNVVYVESNIGKVANKNSIFAWSNDGAGNLTPLSGSPFLTGGTGFFTATPAVANVFQGDQEVVINKGGSLLLAVNGHSNNISVFKINSDGTLTVVAGSPFPSNGPNPISLGLAERSPAGAIVVVGNQAGDPSQSNVPNFNTVRLGAGGTLTPITGSTITLPAGSLAAQALISPSDRFVFGLQFMGGGNLISWDISLGGKLIENNAMIPPNGGPVFLGSTANPLYRVLYVGLPEFGQVAVYNYDKSGTLSFIKTVANSGFEVCWLTANKEATRLYTSETGSNSVSVYDIEGHFNTPTELQHLTLSAGGTATNLKLDPSGKFLYVLGANMPSVGTGNVLHVLNVGSDGTLTETKLPVTIAEPNGEEPEGLAVVQK